MAAVSKGHTRRPDDPPGSVGTPGREWLTQGEIRGEIREAKGDILEEAREMIKEGLRPLATAVDKNSEFLQQSGYQMLRLLGDGDKFPGKIDEVLDGQKHIKEDVKHLEVVVEDHHKVADARFEEMAKDQKDMKAQIEAQQCTLVELEKRRFFLVYVYLKCQGWLLEKGEDGKTRWDRLAVIGSMVGGGFAMIKPHLHLSGLRHLLAKIIEGGK